MHVTTPATLLDFLFDEPRTGRCLVAPDGTVLRANRAWLELTGLTEEAALGADILGLFPSTRDLSASLHARARAGHHVEVPPHLVRRDGRDLWCEGSVDPIPMEGGTGLLVSARAVLDAGLLANDPAGRPLESQAALQLVLEATTTGLWSWDIDRNVVVWSPEAYRIHGMRPGEFAGTKEAFFALVHPDDRAGLGRRLEAALSAGARYESEFRIVRPDGEVRWVTNRGRAARDAHGRPVRVLGTISDVTEEHVTERALQAHRELVKRVTEVAPVVVYVHDVVSRRNVFVNAEVASLLGHGPESLAQLGSGLVETLMHPDDRARFPEHLARLARLGPGEAAEFEYRMRHADGTERWFVSRDAVFSRDDRGELRELVGVAMDVTERKAAEAASARREELLVRLFQALPVMVTLYQPTLREFRFNDEFRRVLGWTEDDARTGDLLALCYPDPATREAAARHMSSPGSGWREFQVTAKDGTLVPSSWANLHLSDDTQVGIGLDLRERKAAERALREEEARANEANRAKDEFLALLGHELRNPLAPISASLQLMELRAPQVAEKERTVIGRQVEHLTRLVDDLLDVARITRGKVALARRPVALDEVVARAVETALPLLEARRHALDVEVAPGLRVHADPTRLAQVIANLLTNAARYTEPGGRVRVRAEATDTDVALSVQDDGIGLSPEALPRVFDAFFQVRTGGDRRDGGLGIGLALVRSLVELHGGSVSAASDGPGRGSTFTVRLPRLTVEPVEEPPAPGRTGLRGPVRVLVVDDNVDGAEALADLLRLEGHEVRTTVDGPSALELVAGWTPELALLDVGLPGMDGHTLARRLRERLPAVRLVAVTGYGQEADRLRSVAAGFDEHRVKPLSAAALDALLDAAIAARTS